MLPGSPRTVALLAAAVSLANAWLYVAVNPRATVVATGVLLATAAALAVSAAVRPLGLRLALVTAAAANQVLLMLPIPLFVPAAAASGAAFGWVLARHGPALGRAQWTAMAVGAVAGAAVMAVAVWLASAGLNPALRAAAGA